MAGSNEQETADAGEGQTQRHRVIAATSLVDGAPTEIGRFFRKTERPGGQSLISQRADLEVQAKAARLAASHHPRIRGACPVKVRGGGGMLAQVIPRSAKRKIGKSACLGIAQGLGQRFALLGKRQALP